MSVVKQCDRLSLETRTHSGGVVHAVSVLQRRGVSLQHGVDLVLQPPLDLRVRREDGDQSEGRPQGRHYSCREQTKSVKTTVSQCSREKITSNLQLFDKETKFSKTRRRKGPWAPRTRAERI